MSKVFFAAESLIAAPPRMLAVVCLIAGLATAFPETGQAQDPLAPAGEAQKQAQQQPQQQAVPKAKDRYWTTRWEFDDIDIKKLAGRLKAVGIDLGVKMQGVVSVSFDVGIPLTSLRDGAAYRFDGSLDSPRLIIEDIEFRDLQSSVKYRDGVANLTNLKASVVERGSSPTIDSKRETETTGTLSGEASVQLVPQKDVTAELEVSDLSLAPLSDLIAKLVPSQEARLPQDGVLTGKVRLKAPLGSIRQIETYELQGGVQCERLRLATLPPANVTIGAIDIRDGRLRVNELDLKTAVVNAERRQIQLIGKADIPLSFQGDFTFEFAGDDLPMGDVANLISASAGANGSNMLDGKLDFRLQGSGELKQDPKDSTWTIGGSVASPSLRLAGIDLGRLEHDLEFTPTRIELSPRGNLDPLPESFKVEQIRFDYQINEKALVIESLAAKIFRGQISGNVTVPRDGAENLVADLQVDALRPSIRVTFVGKAGAEISSTVSGQFAWQVPLNALSDPIQHRGTAVVALQEILLANESVGELTAKITADDGQLSFAANGECFGGTLNVQSGANMQANDLWNDVLKRLNPSKVRFDKVSIDSMLGSLVNPDSGLSGDASGEIEIDFDSWDRTKSVLPDAKVAMDATRVAHRSQLLSRKMQVEGRIENDIFEIQRFVGDYASGSVRLRGRAYLFDSKDAFHPRTDLRIGATRVKLQRGLWFLGDTADQLDGLASLNATIAGFRESIRIRGNVTGRELAAFDLPIGSAHSGLSLDANLRSWSWNLGFPSVRSSVGGGQLEGEVALASGRRGGVDLSSRWKTRRVDFFQLTNQFGQSSSLASGEISGEMSLRGKSIRSLDDLAGRFDFQLGQTRGAAVPGLIAASQFLGPVSLARQSFDAGNARGIIGRGAVVIDEFWLGSDTALVQADGKVFLRSGRMDLNALIATGDYRDVAANFAQLAQQYALRSVLPASAILSVSELLRDRALVISVMGTTQNPIIRLRPIETFREEAARFLLREGQRLILAGISAGAYDGLDRGF